jgi:HTH-type transcriptional regulator / antitoxin HigA
MSSAVRKKKYTKLSVALLPREISTDEEYYRLLPMASELMTRHLSLTVEEEKLLIRLAKTLAAYEDKRFTFHKESVSPLEMLKFNMDNHNHTAKDLWNVIGDKGTVSKILSGKRAISKSMAKRLGEFYHLSPALFI